MQHRNIRQAAELIARHLGADVLLVDIGGRPIADTRQQHLADNRPLPEGILARYRLLLHINSQGQDVGCLYVDGSRATPALMDRVLPFSSFLLTPLLLWFDREDIGQTNRLRALDDLVRGLAGGTLQMGEEALSRARALGLRLTRPYYCLVSDIVLNDAGRDLQVWLDDHELELHRLLLQKGFVPMVTVHWNHIVVFAETDVPSAMLLDRLSRVLRVTFPEVSCVWGVSSEDGSQEFDRLYREARLASDLCRREDGAGGVYRQADIVLYRLISGCLEDAGSRRMREDLIRPLLDYDAASGTALTEVLLCYLHCNGNVCQTAQVLHFHRQSLRYRLRKIEELLGTPLSDHERMLQVELSLRLHRFGPVAH